MNLENNTLMEEVISTLTQNMESIPDVSDGGAEGPKLLDSEIERVTSSTDSQPERTEQKVQDPIQTKYAQAESVKTEAIQAEVVQADVVQAEPVQAESVETETVDTEKSAPTENQSLQHLETVINTEISHEEEIVVHEDTDELKNKPVEESASVDSLKNNEGEGATESTEIKSVALNQIATEETKLIQGEENEIDDSRVKDFILSKPKEDVEQFSDDDISLDESSDDSSSDSESDSSSSESSDSSDEEEEDKEEVADELEEEDEAATGPITSKNEVSDETAPTLPTDYKIQENSPLELVGTISGIVEKNIIVKANVSGEFRVLKDNSVLCLEDRQVLGPLFETFGRLQAPNYRIKFNTQEEIEKFKDKKGAKVFYVVPDSQFLYTDSIKKLKGTDASNCHDEELPEEEQEFSDDEQELAAKQEKKRKKKQKKTPQATDDEPSKKKQNSKPDQKFVSYGFAANQTPSSLPSTPQYVAQQQHHNPSLHGNAYAQPQQYASNPYGVPFNQVQANPYGQPYAYPQPQPQYYGQPHFQNQAAFQGQQYQVQQNQMQQQYHQYQQPMHYQQPVQQPMHNMGQHPQVPAQYQQAMTGQTNYPQAQWAQPNDAPSTLHQLQQLVANGLTQNQSQQNQNQQQNPEGQ